MSAEPHLHRVPQSYAGIPVTTSIEQEGAVIARLLPERMRGSGLGASRRPARHLCDTARSRTEIEACLPIPSATDGDDRVTADTVPGTGMSC
jgi:hypothetical protein